MTARRFMRVELVGGSWGPVAGVRGVRPEDEAVLGRLMYRAYVGTVDYDGETVEQAAAEIRKTYEGEYGEFDPECSAIYEHDGEVISATLITRFEGRPFVAFSMTAPEFKNRGYARLCLQAAMGALRRAGEPELRLVVTVANEPAVAVYRRLGFEFEE